jgi:hypothetical protein
MTRENALKAAALKGSIQTISKLIEALEQQQENMQRQLEGILTE